MGCDGDKKPTPCPKRNPCAGIKGPPSFYQRNKMAIRMATLGAATLIGGFLFYKHCLHDMVDGNEGSCGCECGTKSDS